MKLKKGLNMRMSTGFGRVGIIEVLLGDSEAVIEICLAKLEYFRHLYYFKIEYLESD